jgi:hypothetical protein
MCNCATCNETEDENSFWADVYYYMKENNCDDQTAIRAVEPSYRK